MVLGSLERTEHQLLARLARRIISSSTITPWTACVGGPEAAGAGGTAGTGWLKSKFDIFLRVGRGAFSQDLKVAGTAAGTAAASFNPGMKHPVNADLYQRIGIYIKNPIASKMRNVKLSRR